MLREVRGEASQTRAKEDLMKRAVLLIVIISFLTIGMPADEKELIKKGRKLFDEGKYVEALDLFNKGITEFGETETLLLGKYWILKTMKRYDEALETALKRFKILTNIRPKEYIRIATLYLEKGDKEKGFKWIKDAIDAGFKQFDDLETDAEFASIRNDKRLKELNEAIKKKCGVGQPAKDFTVTLISGEKFTLSTARGKVVLVDFWGTLCPPCIEEIPNMKKDYAKFKSRGFEIIGISLDNNREKLTAFMDKVELPWPIAFSKKGWAADIVKLYEIYSIPSTWLVDRKGVLREIGLRGEKLSKAIAQLMVEK